MMQVFCPPCGESFEDQDDIVIMSPGSVYTYTCPNCKSELEYTLTCEVAELDE